MIGKATGRARALGGFIAVGLVVSVVLGMLPAGAQTTPALTATGSVNIRNVLASSEGKTFAVTVNNTTAAPGTLGTAADPINYVRIIAPQPRMAVLDTQSGPSGWNARVLGTGASRHVIFDGGTIARGASQTFQVAVDVLPSEKDRVGSWVIEVSNDSGAGFTNATGFSNQDTNVRILQVLPGSFSILSPAGAADDSDGNGIPEVTATQSGVCARFRIINHGSQTLPAVEPSVSGSGATAGAISEGSGLPCAGAVLPDSDGDGKGEVSLAPSGFADVDLLLSFGSAGTANLTGKADSANPSATTPDPVGAADDTFVAKLQATIQAIAQLNYVNNSLQPRAVQPLSTHPFRLNVNKGPSNSPAITLDASQTEISFAGCTDPLELSSSTSIGAGAANNLRFEYGSCQILDIDDNKYPVSGTYMFTDANEFSLPSPASLSIGDQIRIDSLIPNVIPKINVPANAVTSNQPGALKSGSAFSVTGPVTDVNPQTGLSESCTDCSLVSAFLYEYDAEDGGNQVGTLHDITDMCSVSGGNLSCSINWTFNELTLSTEVSAIVQDGAGLESLESFSGLAKVDNIAPLPVAAELKTDPATGDRTLVEVTFSETFVGYPGTDPDMRRQSFDWEVQCEDNSGADSTPPVLTAQLVAGDEGEPAKAFLNLAQECGADIDDGNVNYAPFPGVGGQLANPRVVDRVSHNLVDFDFDIVDRIPPLAPIISAVNGGPAQDGKFWFNGDFTVTLLDREEDGRHAVQAGYLLQIIEERNGIEGPQDDEIICEASANTSSVDVPCTVRPEFVGFNPVTEDGGYDESSVYARALDPSRNLGATAQALFALDTNAPVIDSVNVVNTNVTVNLIEPAPEGRNFATDWQLWGIQNDERRGIALGTVSGSGRSRTISINDGRYNATVDLTELHYTFAGAEAAQRYTDRAGNPMQDQSTNAL